MDDEARQTSAAARPTEERWAELADLMQIINREIQFRGYTDERAIVLSPSEGMVMRYLHQVPAATPSNIAAATGLQRTNLSTVLRGLEGKGIIERHAHPGDGRGVTVHVTDRGRENYAIVRNEWARTVATAAEHDTEHLDATLALLSAIETGLTTTRPRIRAERPTTSP